MEAQGQCASARNDDSLPACSTLTTFRHVLREMSLLCRKSFFFLFDCTQMNATVCFLIEDNKTL